MRTVNHIPAANNDVALEGDVSFALTGSSATIRVERLTNQLADSSTGTLLLKLWALQVPAENGHLRGHVVALSKLPALDARQSRRLEEHLDASAIPRGYYFPAISLEERNSSLPGGWSLADVKQFDQPMYFGERIELGAEDLRLLSATEYQLTLSEIRNNTTHPTGRLRATIWATREPWRGGPLKGFRLLVSELGILDGDGARHHIVFTFERRGKAHDAPFAVLFIEELGADDEWLLRESWTDEFPKTATANAQEQSREDSETDVISPEDLIGQERAKAALAEVVALARVNAERRRRGLKPPQITLHAVFAGNPGTGKTTFARFYAQQIKSIGLLARGHLVEASRATLVAEFQGQTAKRTADAVKSALGGVLFIDEAYALKNGENDSYGQDCINTLVKEMEDHRGELVVICAGYSLEMREFLRQNSGLESRIPNIIDFQDFADTELGNILDVFCRQAGVALAAGLRDRVVERIAIERRARSFANARSVRNIFEDALARQAVRLSRGQIESASSAQLSTLCESDFDLTSERSGESSPVARLNALIGLNTVKHDVLETVAFARVERARHRGSGLAVIQLHRMYAGAPGMGKKTVARLYGDCLRELGMLARGHTVEVRRSELIGPYIGQTAPKTQKCIDAAMGGIFYLDDAPSLWLRADRYETDAIEAILAAAELQQDKIVFVFAGSEAEINRIYTEDARLQRLFPNPLTFQRLADEELCALARRLSEAGNNHLTDDAWAELRGQILAASTSAATPLTAGGVLSLLQRAYKRRAVRLNRTNDLSTLDPSALRVVEREDLASI